ncbi:hypothetical protein WYG_2585 [Citrobacter sp. A1]|nr:hypothetical protein WYG_2585 [Citrobacter sp. A1]EKU35483.1 rz1-like qin prophage [Citrobacter sp. L17]KLV45205.1 hypothetical protein SK31_00963 [Citrobacter sp. MGH99]
MTVVLTATQIEDLAAFAKEDGQPQYTTLPGQSLNSKLMTVRLSLSTPG